MILITITGACGSGKTTFSKKLCEKFKKNNISCAVLNGDHYYKDHSCLDENEKKQHNFCKPKCIDYELLIKHLKALKANKSIQRPSHDFFTCARLFETIRLDPVDVVILEGILVLNHSFIKKHSDITVFIKLKLDICLSRRLLRDHLVRKQPYEYILNKYETNIRPSFFKFTRPAGKDADFVIRNDDEKPVMIRKLICSVQNMLRKRNTTTSTTLFSNTQMNKEITPCTV